MKKVSLVLALVLCVSVVGFSQEEAHSFKMDTWFTTGASFGNYFFSGKRAENDYIGSPGLNLSFYSLFGEKQIGLFFNYGIVFPSIYKPETDYDKSVQLDYILLGFGYGYNFNESIKLHMGIGPHLSFFDLINDVDNKTKIDNFMLGFGFGGDIGIKFNITKFVCIDFGTTLAYNFAVLNEVRTEIKGDDGWRHTKTETSSWKNVNAIIGIKPYISVGFNIDSSKLGKN